jgi:hypothetical protein
VKIHSPEFEKKLTAIVRDAVLENAAWTRIWNQRKWGGWSKLRGLLGLSLSPAFGVIIVGFVLGQTASHEQLVAAIACYSLGSIFYLGGQVSSIVNCKDSDRFALDNLPISDAKIFDFNWHGLCVSTRMRCLTGMGFGVALLEFPPDTLMEWVGLFVFAVLYWRISSTLGALIGAYLPYLLSTLTGMTLLIIPIGLGLYHGSFTGFFIPLSDPLISVVNISFPTAWLAQFIGWFSDPEHSRNWIFAIPLLLILTQLPRTLRRLRSTCQYHEPASFVVADDEELEKWVASKHGEFTAGFTEADSALRITDSATAELDRDFLRPVPIHQQFGFIERWIYAWFTPREKLLTEAFCQLPLRLTANWVRCMKLLVICAIVSAALPPLIGWGIYPQIVVGAFILPLLFSLGDFEGRALSSARGNNQLVFHSGFPVSFRELQAMSLKATLNKSFAALLPASIFVALLSCSWGAVWFLDGPKPLTTFGQITFGAETGIELVLLWLVYSPALNASEYAERSTANKRDFFRAIPFLTVAVPVTVISMLTVVVTVVSSTLWVTLATLAFGAICSFLVFKYYEKTMNGPRDDLVPSKRKR